MIILGIDPALINIGWALIEYNEKENKYTHIVSGLIKVPQRYKSLVEKLTFINIKITNLMNEFSNEYKIDIIGIEKPFVNCNAKSSINFACSVGTIMSILGLYKKKSEHKINIIEIHPRTVKHFVSGKGDSNKEEISKYVKLIFNSSCPEFQSYDVSDALAIAYTAVNNKRIFNIN